MDALSCISWESSQKEEVEPLIGKTLLQSRMKPEVNIPEEYFTERVLLQKYDCGHYAQIDSKGLGQGTDGGYGYPQNSTTFEI